MRYVLIVKASKHSEAGIKPQQDYIKAMAAYNLELARAGVLISADRLQPSSCGMRIVYPVPGAAPVMEAGPFAGSNELVAGITLIDVNTQEEALTWAMRMPDPNGYGEGAIELREVLENR